MGAAAGRRGARPRARPEGPRRRRAATAAAAGRARSPRRSRGRSNRARRSAIPLVGSSAVDRETTSSDAGRPRTAYGLRLLGIDGGRLLSPAGDDRWPEVRVALTGSDDTSDWRPGFGGRRACVNLAGGMLRAEREQAGITIRTDAPATDEMLVHPWLAAGAAVFARWHCRDAFHGGAVAVDGQAWAVFAPKEGGKSTLLAHLAARGVPVVSDDLLVLEDGDVYAGARCVDLPPGPAEALGLSELRPVRRSTRLRLALGPVRAPLPLGGVVYLAWGEDVVVTRIPMRERIPRARLQNAVGALPPSESGLLRLVALPTFELRRPRDFDAVPAGADALLEAIGA